MVFIDLSLRNSQVGSLLHAFLGSKRTRYLAVTADLSDFVPGVLSECHSLRTGAVKSVRLVFADRSSVLLRDGCFDGERDKVLTFMSRGSSVVLRPLARDGVRYDGSALIPAWAILGSCV